MKLSIDRENILGLTLTIIVFCSFFLLSYAQSKPVDPAVNDFSTDSKMIEL